MKNKPYIVLGIETSCDETAVAIVRSDKTVLAHHVLSQIEEHAAFGGVVPEIAARSHVTQLDRLIQASLDDAGLTLKEVDAIAATTGPGLVGGLMVGALTGKALARAANKVFYAINHLEGHALTARLTDEISFPFLLLLVSGGHCQLLDVAGVGHYERLGSTIDDAVGEAFDKTAKLLGLSYPGGPAVEKMAKIGDEKRFAFPRPLKNQNHMNFSFSGLKSAVRREAEKCVAAEGVLTKEDVADICAGFQAAIIDCLEDRVCLAMATFQVSHPKSFEKTLVVAGGVAANKAIKERLTHSASAAGFTLVAPPLEYCTDNGVMIAWAGMEKLLLELPDESAKEVTPRWPLDEMAASLYGHGKKGAKV